MQSTTIGRRAQRADTEIGSSRYGRCGSFSIEFCSRLSWISIRAAADAQASQEARLLTEAADHRQAALTCLRARAIRVELSLLTRAQTKQSGGKLASSGAAMPAQAARCGELHAAPAGSNSGSLMTRRWRGMDSNPWSPVSENGFRDCRRLAFHAHGLTMSAISDVIAANILVASFL